MDDELNYLIGDIETIYEELTNKSADIDMKAIDLEDNIKDGNVDEVDGDLIEIMAILDDIIAEAQLGKNIVNDKIGKEEFRKKLVKEAI